MAKKKVYCKDCKFYLGKRNFWNLFHDYCHTNPACIVAYKNRKQTGISIEGEKEYDFPIID